MVDVNDPAAVTAHGNSQIDQSLQQDVLAAAAADQSGSTTTSNIVGGSWNEDPNAAARFVSFHNQGQVRNRRGQGYALDAPYLEEDVAAQWGAMGQAQQVMTQQALVAMGYIDAVNPKGRSPYRGVGVLDEATRAGFKDVLAEANATGIKWEELYNVNLSLLQRGVTQPRTGGGGGGGGGGGAPRPVYRPLDKSTVRQMVKGAVKEYLNRDPLPEELNQISNEINSWTKEAFNNDVRGRGAQINPRDRLAELMEERFSGEIGMIEQRQQSQLQNRVAADATSIVDRLTRVGV